MKVKIKKLVPNAIIPKYAKEGDVGMDLTAVSKTYDEDNNVVYDTGIAVQIPEGFFGLVFPRSSNSKKDLTLTNSVGVIDSGYRGSIILKYKRMTIFNTGIGEIKEYNVGDRVGQLIILPHPYIDFIESDDLSDTKRGVGGFGSTGN